MELAGPMTSHLLIEAPVTALAAYGAGLMRLGFGIGAGILFTPLLTLIYDAPRRALATMIPLHWVSDLQGAVRYRQHWQWQKVAPFLAGALPATWLGSSYLSLADPAQVKRLIGMATLVAGLLQIGQQAGWLRLPAFRHNRWYAMAAGVTIGFIGAITNAHGVLLAVYLLQLGGSKEQFVGMTSVILLVLDSFRLITYWYHGIGTAWQLAFPLLFAPLIWAGGRAGYQLNRRLPTRPFFVALSLAVSLLGLVLFTG